MPPIKRRKKLHKQQSRTLDGRFGPKRINKQLPTQNELNNNEGTDDDIFELKDMEEWGDDDDSGWEDEINLEKEKEKFMNAELGKQFINLFFIYSLITICFI